MLDDVEEARLIHLGVSRGFPLGDRVACIFDIGGGSTEFIVGDAERPYYLHSVRLGSLRLYNEFLAGDPSEAAYPALDLHIRETLRSFTPQLSEYPFDVLVGTSGTAMGLALLAAENRGVTLQRAHGYTVRVDDLRELQRIMMPLSPAERRKLPGMNPRRSDIIVAGNAIVIAIAEALHVEDFVISERALREGIVVDFLERDIALARRLGDERTRRFDEAHALARRFGAMGVHEQHVASLAVALFDGLAERHRFEPADRDVLFAAALMHDVGRAIAGSAPHKHGAYIVRNAGLAGWRPEEVELLAALVRYHRKSLPKPAHPEVAATTPAGLAKIEGLAALLRVADGLDRRRFGVVAGLEVRSSGDEFALVLGALQDVAPEIEAARFKADLFERVFGPVRFEAVLREIEAR